MPITGQTAGPIGLKFFRDTHGGRGVFKAKKIRKFFFSIFFFFFKIVFPRETKPNLKNFADFFAWLDL